MQEHEYAILNGFNRSQLGRYLAVASAAISAGIVFLLLTAVDVANRLGIPASLPPSILSLVGAGSVFYAIYWIFNHYAWRWKYISQALKLPDLAGDWSCEGTTLDANTGKPVNQWNATVTIVQTWDKIRVRLKTAQSGSNSITAALLHDSVDGYKLLYNYQNEPHIGEVELKAHMGYAQLEFSRDLQVARGEYFNGHGRYTFGTLNLKRN